VSKYGRHPISDRLLRLGEEKKKKIEEDRYKPQHDIIMACPIPQGGLTLPYLTYGVGA